MRLGGVNWRCDAPIHSRVLGVVGRRCGHTDKLGFLVRHQPDIARRNGPGLFVRKLAVRSFLHIFCPRVRKLGRCGDAAGAAGDADVAGPVVCLRGRGVHRVVHERSPPDNIIGAADNPSRTNRRGHGGVRLLQMLFFFGRKFDMPFCRTVVAKIGHRPPALDRFPRVQFVRFRRGAADAGTPSQGGRGREGGIAARAPSEGCWRVREVANHITPLTKAKLTAGMSWLKI
mmetsp:Transcript_16335/g.48652  ORF Transcript_16335/g.48652 Transcript_16335/m.48652 type:complete len:230 (+) Transcript_16335:918-1607(+)